MIRSSTEGLGLSFAFWSDCISDVGEVDMVSAVFRDALWPQDIFAAGKFGRMSTEYLDFQFVCCLLGRVA